MGDVRRRVSMNGGRPRVALFEHIGETVRLQLAAHEPAISCQVP